MPSSGMCVFLVRTDVSEERVATLLQNICSHKTHTVQHPRREIGNISSLSIISLDK
jgi:hypothetical protein